jgi:DNA-directed RNA polymerase specialized sigma24 family protein
MRCTNMVDNEPDGRVVCQTPAAVQPTEEAERALVACISAGDRSAMEKLYVLYFARLANFFLHLTARVDLVEALINDTMLEVWREGAPNERNASVAVWIMGLAYSRGRKYVAKVGGSGLHAPPSTEHTEHTEHDHPRSMTLKGSPDESLLRLPVEERALLHLVYAGAHSRQDIAKIMNISCKCVDVLLADARCGLRRGD